MNILVIGEWCRDEFIYGVANRICPEAPVPVFTPINTTTNDGMAANVVNNIKGLGYINVDCIHQHSMITKTRLIDKKSNQMLLRVDRGEDNIKPLDINKLNDISKYDIVIVSDYNKGFLENSTLKFIANNSKFCILDTKKTLTDDVSKPFNFIKLNEFEYENNKNISKDNLIVTLGRRGALYNGNYYKQENPMDTIDVSGAGDTFVAAFSIKYMETKDIDTSINFANRCASIVVSKRGVVPIKLTDIKIN